jgi:hypothetical protein
MNLHELLIYLFIIYCFTSPSRIFHFNIWRRRYCRWKAANFRPMLGAQGHWAGRGLYRATLVVTRSLDFSDLIRTFQFSRLVRHTRKCGGLVLTRIFAGPHSVASYDTQEDAEDLFLPGSLLLKTWILTVENIDNQLFVCTRIHECLLLLYNSQYAESMIIHVLHVHGSTFLQRRSCLFHDNYL